MKEIIYEEIENIEKEQKELIKSRQVKALLNYLSDPTNLDKYTNQLNK